MNVEYMEPFVRAAFNVLEATIGSKPEKEKLSIRKNSFTTQQLTILAGVNGDVEGTAMFGMSLETALKIAGTMMCAEITEMDDMAISAVSELGNMIAGNAITLLSQKGMSVDITPPSIIRGGNVELSTMTPALVIPVMTTAGRIEINVAIAENLRKAA